MSDIIDNEEDIGENFLSDCREYSKILRNVFVFALARK